MEPSYPVDRVTRFAGTNKRSVYMEPSYLVDRVTRFAGTNKRFVYVEPSYSALICSIHCSYMKYRRTAAILTWKENTCMRCWQTFIPACRVSRAKRLHGKIFISPGRDPASFHRELTKASYPFPPCKHFTGKPIEGELPDKRITRSTG